MQLGPQTLINTGEGEAWEAWIKLQSNIFRYIKNFNLRAVTRIPESSGSRSTHFFVMAYPAKPSVKGMSFHHGKLHIHSWRYQSFFKQHCITLIRYKRTSQVKTDQQLTLLPKEKPSPADRGDSNHSSLLSSSEKHPAASHSSI